MDNEWQPCQGSSYLFVAVQTGSCLIWSEIHETGLLVIRLIYRAYHLTCNKLEIYFYRLSIKVYNNIFM